MGGIFIEAINQLKSRLRILHTSDLLFARVIYTNLRKMYMFLSCLWRFINVKDYRRLQLLKVFKARSIHQTTTITFLNRYPKVFSACKEYFNGMENLRILSFGCSTGEEVLSLRGYFPNSRIIGADINKTCIQTCQMRIQDKNTKFIISKNRNLEDNGPYDMILCMAVFQRTPDLIESHKIMNIKKIYPFKRFNKQIESLDKLLKTNGLFVMHFSQYLFQDTTIALNYDSYGSITQVDYNKPIFDKNGDILIDSAPQYTIHIKQR